MILPKPFTGCLLPRARGAARPPPRPGTWPRRLHGRVIDGAAGRRGLGGDLDPPGSRNVLLDGVGDDVAVGAIVEHLAVKRTGHEPDGEHAAFEPQRHAVLDDRAQERLLLENLRGRAAPSLAEVTGRHGRPFLCALHGGCSGGGRPLHGRRRGYRRAGYGRSRGTRRRGGSFEETGLSSGGTRRGGRGSAAGLPLRPPSRSAPRCACGWGRRAARTAAISSSTRGWGERRISASASRNARSR